MVRRERQDAILAMILRKILLLSKDKSKAPASALFKTSIIKSQALLGKHVSACKKSRISEVAIFAPAFICLALPFSDVILIIFLFEGELLIKSRLEVSFPSTNIIS